MFWSLTHIPCSLTGQICIILLSIAACCKHTNSNFRFIWQISPSVSKAGSSALTPLTCIREALGSNLSRNIGWGSSWLSSHSPAILRGSDLRYAITSSFYALHISLFTNRPAIRRWPIVWDIGSPVNENHSSSERRHFMPQTARPLWSTYCYNTYIISRGENFM
jgi:hypothetical protein